MKIKSMAEISLFAVLSAVGARIMIPVPFVPFTLQTLVCMLAGFALGARKGAASQLLYMLMGLVGIPVFTSAAGPAAVFMPSFGYIPGFVCCAWICGALAERMRARYGEPGFRALLRGGPAWRRGHIRRRRRISVRDSQLLGSAGGRDLLQGAFDRLPQHRGRRRREGRGRRDGGGEAVARGDWKIKRTHSRRAYDKNDAAPQTVSAGGVSLLLA